MKCLFPAALALCVSLPASAETAFAPHKAHVLDTLVVTENNRPSLPLREISGLAWDADDHILYAVSDRNELFHLALDPTQDHLGLAFVASHRLRDDAGTRLRKREFAAEGIALIDAHDGVPGNTELAIVSELPPRLALFDHNGRMRRAIDLPAPLLDITALRSPRNGLESVTFHPRLGFLLAPEVPLAGQRRHTHLIYHADGPVLAYNAREVSKTNIKAMETLPNGRLVLLERSEAQEGVFLTFLRLLAVEDCPIQLPCAGQKIALVLPAPPDADFEGITWLGDNRLLIASDDRVDETLRTVFVLLRLEIPASRDASPN